MIFYCFKQKRCQVVVCIFMCKFIKSFYLSSIYKVSFIFQKFLSSPITFDKLSVVKLSNCPSLSPKIKFNKIYNEFYDKI